MTHDFIFVDKVSPLVKINSDTYWFVCQFFSMLLLPNIKWVGKTVVVAG